VWRIPVNLERFFALEGIEVAAVRRASNRA